MRARGALIGVWSSTVLMRLAVATLLKLRIWRKLSRIVLPASKKSCMEVIWTVDLSTIADVSAVKALLSPRGAYLILETPKGGLLERGAIQKVR